MNTLYYGDNLTILREYIKDEARVTLRRNQRKEPSAHKIQSELLKKLNPVRREQIRHQLLENTFCSMGWEWVAA